MSAQPMPLDGLTEPEYIAGLRNVERIAGVPPRLRLRAYDPAHGIDVLVKTDADAAAIHHEADLLARLERTDDASAIPALVDVGCRPEGGGAWLRYRWIQGVTLAERLRAAGGRIAWTELRPIVLGLAALLTRLHRQGVLHRDVKPGNIVIRPGGAPALIDFSAAARLDGSSPPDPSLLTRGFAAPEQFIVSGDEGPWTDVYGLAATAWRALAGGLPGTTPLPGDVPPAVALALRRALAADPRHRPQSAAAFGALLAGAGPAGPQWAGRPGTDAPGAGPMDSAERPTEPVERRPADALPPPPPADEGGGHSRGRPVRRRWLVPVLIIVALVLALVAVFGRPAYERYVKQDWTVDASGGGDVASIGEAIVRARDGAVVRIAPGTYAESIALDRPLTLMATDPGHPPLVAPPAGQACLTTHGDGSVVTQLSLRGSAAEADTAAPCVDIAGGSPRFDGTHIAGGAGPAILVHDGAAPALVGTVIDAGGGAGIVVTAGSRPSIEGNRITDVAGPAMVVRGGADPLISGALIERSGGVVFGEGARGTFRDNGIRDARASAIEIGGGADPQISGNAIERPAQSGLYVYDNGRGRFEGNTLTGSHLSGVVLAGAARTRLTGNTIADAGEHGILVLAPSAATIAGNTVRNSKRNGIVVSAGTTVELGDNVLQGNASPQLVDLRPAKAKGSAP